MSNDKGEDAFFNHFCQNVRRFTDHHLSSMLHSLIGLPSMVTPPPGQTWVIIDEDMRPKKERAYSDGDGRLEGKTLEEIQKLKATWIAERDGNGRGGLETGGGGGGGGEDKTKVEPESSSSSSSSTSFPADQGSGRAIYVFRFPSSYSRYGFSDSPCPDAYQQVDRMNNHMRRSFFDDDLFSLGIQSFFGLLHPFMFSPFAGLPRLHDYRHYPPLEGGMEDYDSWRRMRDEEIRWAKKVYGHFFDDSSAPSRENNGEQATPSKAKTEQPLSLPPPPSHSSENTQEKETQPGPETELDLYEYLDSSDSKEKSSLAIRTQGSPHIIGTSTSTESRILPDGSSFTKTIKITRYEDGTEQRLENVHSTPPRDENRPATQDNDSDLQRHIAQRSERYTEDSPVSAVSVFGRGFREDRMAAHHDLDRMGDRMFEFLMQSPFFEDVKRSKHSYRPDNFSVPERPPRSEKTSGIPERHGEDSMPQQSRTVANEEGNEAKWGWFWRK